MSELNTILAIETSTVSCSVAVLVKERVVSTQKVGATIHSEAVLSMIRDTLTQSGISLQDLQAISVSHGPGSFTGLRVGVGVAQGIAYAHDLPIIGIDSLTILAQQCKQEGIIIAGLDARMQEIYWAVFERSASEVVMIKSVQLSAPEQIENLPHNGVLIGNAWQVYHARLPKAFDMYACATECVLPHARDLLEYVHTYCNAKAGVSAEAFELIYVRNDVAKKSQKPSIV